MQHKDKVENSNFQKTSSRLKKYLSKENAIAALAIAGIALHLALRFLLKVPQWEYDIPLFAALFLGGGPLVYELAEKAARREFGSDLLAGLSIVVSVILGEYLAGTLVVLMLSGGNVLEAYAIRSASSML